MEDRERRLQPPRSLRAVGSAALLAPALLLPFDLAGSQAAAGGARAAPTVLRPDPARAGESLDLPRGKVLLFGLLQQAADRTGQVLVVDGRIPPEETVRLGAVPARLSVEELGELLAPLGFELRRSRYGGEEVTWVLRTLRRSSGKRGAIVRRAAGGGSGGTPSGPAGSPVPGVKPLGVPGLGLYRRLDGKEPVFLVVYETGSAERAEEVYSIVQAALAAAGAGAGQ